MTLVRTEAPAVLDRRRVQRRTLTLLFGTQMTGGVGVAIGVSVGALLAADLAGTSMSGLASSAAVVGGALLAIPVSAIIRRSGRRPGLAVAYLVGTLGALVIVGAAMMAQVPLLFLGMMLFGGGTTANLQARYAAVDLAEPAHRGRHLSLIVWATTIGAVAAPNFAQLADRSVHRFGLAEYSGPFVFSAAAFILAATAITVLMRPDPLLTARTLDAATAADAPRSPDAPSRPAPGRDAVPRSARSRPIPPRAVPAGYPPQAMPAGAPAPDPLATPSAPVPSRGLAEAARAVAVNPAARLGIAAVAVGHLVMVGMMSMTPVHIGSYVHHHPDVLRVVGLVLSLHTAGMYALAPLVGWLTDRNGRRPVILAGLATLVVACALAGSAGDDTPRLSLGLALIGLGWSGTMVAGSTLLSESVDSDLRPAVQGLADLVMGLAGASGGAVSGVVVAAAGYPTLATLAAIATVPLMALALRPVARTREV
jgi:MFS family permease